jgi:tetratricopeptide (TPR) repeat protein
MEAVFVFTVHPAYPLERFARGEIGVVQPSYARSYLYVVYRYLNNSSFTPEEQEQLTQLWNERLNNSMELGEDAWIKTWLDARQKVPGLPKAPKIQAFRNREKPNEYESYVNCTQDAFDNAAATLNDRIKRYGAETSAVKQWVEGQDQVFANCSEGQHIPGELDSSAEQAAKADRNYQIAAAHFYASKFDEAQNKFAAIASDGSSPWRFTASYLVARTLIRKASLGPEETKKDSLAQAENQLKKVLADKKLANVHSASGRLLDLVRLRLRPNERLHELAHTLASKTSNDHLKQDLWDYTFLLDGVLGSEETAKDAKPNDELRTDDLTDWISTLQGNTEADLQRSTARWQATHSPAWLIAILSKVNGKTPNASEFIRDAMNVKPNTAAFSSARFHAVRLLVESAKYDEARTILDQLLKNNRNQLDSSTLNLLLGQRMMLATNLADFLSHTPRVPATLSWNDDGREIPSEAADVSDENKKLIGKPLFDNDAATVLDKQLPLSILKEATASQTLPPHLRKDLTQAVWIRAVLLGDYKTADELVPELKDLAPELAAELDNFAKATQPDDKKFTALFTWLKSPGIEPVVDIGIGRESPLEQQDTYRDNWWCASSETPASTEEQSTEADVEITSFTASSLHAPLFLTDAQRTAGAKEWTALTALGTMPNYLCKQVIQWANKNPTDPRVPEALHLAVNSTRYGCTDKDTGRWSKAAFDLLHRKYPTSSWAKKTKYWFKE